MKLISSDLQEVDDVKAEKGDAGAEKTNDKNRKFLTHVQSKYYLKFSEAYERRNHGVISCLVLMKNLVFFLETDCTLDGQRPLNSDDAKQFLIRRNILRAIAAHSNSNVYYLRLVEFPFLLTICDELHETERPRFMEIIGGEAVKLSVAVQALTANSIHYKVTFSEGLSKLDEGGLKQAKAGVLQYFLGKFDKLSRILRSAVGGEWRNLTVTLEVENRLETPSPIYKLIHRTPQDVKITLNGKDTSWLELEESNKSGLAGR